MCFCNKSDEMGIIIIVAIAMQAGSRGGSGGSNPPFKFQIILQCMDDVCCA